MPLQKLETLLARHGHFHCLPYTSESHATEKTVPFRHSATPPADVDVPDIGRLREFYRAFGSLAFYHCGDDDAARYLAAPHEWPAYREEFDIWIADIDSDEWADIAPAELLHEDESGHVDLRALVIGNTPHSGNYILMADNGAVYEFDHDGFEFYPIAPDIITYAETLLAPDAKALRDYTTFLGLRDAGDTCPYYVAAVHFADGEVFNLSDEE
ncbi:MAG: hypothetical protein Q4D61_08325 [Cardiobacteriaceae bacterium]|nr:hypothetical protein [Cardiobacteriaceae bacterium]